MAGLLFAAIMAGIVIWEAGSIKRGAVFLLALGVSTLLLSGIAALALKGLKNLPPPDKMTGRYGFANLYRPNNQARSIVTCLGMGIMLVLTVRLVQMDMITMLKENTETSPPNYFFIDIQSDQTETFIRTLDRIAPEAERTLTPLIRSRFHSVDGRLAENW
ncbi:MAG: ABC transporter permease, partial [Nitrospinaceae bacterium]|nr:ABC transporter permease [Nitrospinaceae bacterium]